jgi:zinc transport system substrate-binding protein
MRGRALALVLLALAGCAPAAPPAKPLVVATISRRWEFSRQVAGDRAEVVSLVPAGVEPHDWEPAPRDVSQVRRAAVFVHTGTNLDGWAEKLLADLTGRRGVVVSARGGLSVLTVGGVTDPHVWLDPTLARAQVLAIAGGLEQADPAGAAIYAENAKAFVARLDALDLELAAGLAECARREVVTSHAAFAYLARRYRLTQVPVMGISPEPAPAKSGTMATPAG